MIPEPTIVDFGLAGVPKGLQYVVQRFFWWSGEVKGGPWRFLGMPGGVYSLKYVEFKLKMIEKSVLGTNRGCRAQINAKLGRAESP